MGYDNRFHLVQKRNTVIEINEESYFVAEVIATYEACGLDWEAVDSFTNPEKKTDLAIFDTVFVGCDKDGKEIYNGKYVTEDKYGKPMTEFTIPEAIEILRKAERKEHYRRHTPLLGMLLAIDEAEWGDIRVLHYGH